MLRGDRVPVHLAGRGADVGIWLLDISENILKEIINFIFSNFNVNYVRYRNSLCAIGDYEVINHWKIKLAENKEELWRRLSKKGRYNIRSSIRKLEDRLGVIEYFDYDNGKIPFMLVEEYFSFKKELMGTDYGLSAKEYIEKFHVTNAYEMRVNNVSLAILFSNESCNYVYLENLTYTGVVYRNKMIKFAYKEVLPKIDKGIEWIMALR